MSAADRDRAHSVFLSGKEFLEESDYDKAIGYFKDAYAIDCSVHGLLPVIATAYERKGDKASAIRALREYLKRVPHALDREIVERRIRNLTEQLAEEARPAPPPAPRAPSAVTVPVNPPSPPRQSSTVGAPREAGPAPRTERTNAPPWILVGAGGALSAAGVILFLIGVGDVSAAKNECPNYTCAQSSSVSAASTQYNNGYTLEGVGIAVGGAGLAAVAAGLVWRASRTAHDSRPTGLIVTPDVSTASIGVSVDGRF